MRYQHRPVEVDALRWDGTNLAALRAFAGASDASGISLDVEPSSGVLWVSQCVSADRVFPLARGHWLLRVESGRLLAMSHDRFERLYRPALVAV